MAHEVNLYKYKDRSVVSLSFDSNLENNVYNETKEPTILFLHEILYNHLTPEHKESLGTMLYNDSYSVQDMLKMDILIVLINKEFNCEEFMELVHRANPKHTFVKIQ